MDITGQGTSQ